MEREPLAGSQDKLRSHRKRLRIFGVLLGSVPLLGFAIHVAISQLYFRAAVDLFVAIFVVGAVLYGVRERRTDILYVVGGLVMVMGLWRSAVSVLDIVKGEWASLLLSILQAARGVAMLVLSGMLIVATFRFRKELRRTTEEEEDILEDVEASESSGRQKEAS